MKKQIFSAIIICAVAFVAEAAEKSDIIIKTYTNVLVNAANNYAVNTKGELLTYYFGTDSGGVVNRITYTLYKKDGKSHTGEIDTQYLPTDASNVTVTGLAKNVALIMFDTLAGERIFMTFKMKKTNAVPLPNKDHFTQKIMGPTETCSIDNQRILVFTYTTAAMTDLIGITVFNHSWKALKNKGIDFNPTHGVLTELNKPIQKYYKGVISKGANLYDIQILRP